MTKAQRIEALTQKAERVAVEMGEAITSFEIWSRCVYLANGSFKFSQTIIDAVRFGRQF